MKTRTANRRVRRATTITRLAAAATASALLLAGCSGGGSDEPGGKVTLKVSTFGNFGYTKKLLAKYEQEHPNVTIDASVTASTEDARTNMFTKLAAGSGLADIEAVEIGWTVDLKKYADKFVPVEDDQYGDWVDFQTAPVEAKDGKLFAYGAATGPMAVCYREDLFKKAGLPTDPAQVADLLGDSWESYFAAGDKYLAGGGKGWFDSAYFIFNAQVEQMAHPYEEEDGTVVADNPAVEKVFRDTLAQASRQSAGLEIFTDDWAAATANGGFATMACPSWMLGVIQGNAPDATTWRIADTLPAGGGNVGGSYLAVPTQGKHTKEAAKLASWLTAPAQQIAAFKTAGPFPSRVKSLDDPALAKITNPYFGDAPTGKIFASRSKAVKTINYKGPQYIKIDTAAYEAITRVETGKQSIDAAWKQFASTVNELN